MYIRMIHGGGPKIEMYKYINRWNTQRAPRYVTAVPEHATMYSARSGSLPPPPHGWTYMQIHNNYGLSRAHQNCLIKYGMCVYVSIRVTPVRVRVCIPLTVVGCVRVTIRFGRTPRDGRVCSPKNVVTISIIKRCSTAPAPRPDMQPRAHRLRPPDRRQSLPRRARSRRPLRRRPLRLRRLRRRRARDNRAGPLCRTPVRASLRTGWSADRGHRFFRIFTFSNRSAVRSLRFVRKKIKIKKCSLTQSNQFFCLWFRTKDRDRIFLWANV